MLYFDKKREKEREKKQKENKKNYDQDYWASVVQDVGMILGYDLPITQWNRKLYSSELNNTQVCLVYNNTCVW